MKYGCSFTHFLVSCAIYVGLSTVVRAEMQEDGVSVDSEQHHFELIVLPTSMDPKMDAWYKIPLNSGPQFQTLDSVYRHQLFNVQVLFNISDRGHDAANVTYDLSIRDENGALTDAQAKGVLGFKRDTAIPQALILNEQFPMISFDDINPDGEYKIHITAIENVSGALAEKTIAIQLQTFKFSGFSQSDTPLTTQDWLTNYYTAPKQAYILEGISAIEMTPEYAQNNAAMLGFLGQVLNQDAFLWDELEAYILEKDKANIASKVHLLKALFQAESAYSSETRRLLKSEPWIQQARTQLLSEQVESGMTMDAMWGRFFARGNIEPLEQIMSVFEHHESLGTLEKLKSNALERTYEIEQLAVKESLIRAAVWSLRSNAKKQPLIYKYLIWYYQNEKMSDGGKAILYQTLMAIQKDVQA